MAKKQPGTFADLYEVEQTIKATRPGRPKRQVPRKQFTIYLTREQESALSDLHYLMNKHFKADRSDIAGLALQTLFRLVENKFELSDFRNFESLKVQIKREIEA